MADFKFKLLAYESLMFLAVQFIALATGMQMLKLGQVSMPPPEGGFFRLSQILLAFVVAIVLLIIIIKLLKTPLTFRFFFAFMIFVGSQIVFGAFMPFFLSIPAALGIIALRWWKPNLITHNLAIFLGVAGVAAFLGTSIRPWPEIILLLIAMSVYDFIAVFKTKTMVEMFKELLKRGAPLAIIVPEHPSQFAAPVHRVSKQKLREVHAKDKKVLMLGTGDIAFPALFAVSALATSGAFAAFGVVAGSLVGMAFNHYLLTIKKFKFIPALPFIAGFSIIGYLLAVSSCGCW